MCKALLPTIRSMRKSSRVSSISIGSGIGEEEQHTAQSSSQGLLRRSKRRVAPEGGGRPLGHSVPSNNSISSLIGSGRKSFQVAPDMNHTSTDTQLRNRGRENSFRHDELNYEPSRGPTSRVPASKRMTSGSDSSRSDPDKVKKKPNRLWVKVRIYFALALAWLARTTADFMTSVTYVYKDITRKKRNFCMGVFTVFLVVLFVTTMQNAVQVSPLIFLKLSENGASEMDVVMVQNTNYQNLDSVESTELPLGIGEASQFLVNTTDVRSKWGFSKDRMKKQDLEGVSPRWILPVTVHERDDLENFVDSWLIIFDTDKEKDIGLGRSWSRRKLNEGEVYITESVARTLGISSKTGEKVIVNVNATRLFDTVGIDSGFINNSTLVEDILDALPVVEVEVDAGFNTTALDEAVFDPTDGLGLPNPTNFTFEATNDGNVTTISIPTSIFARPVVESFFESLEWRMVVRVVDGVDHPDGKWPDILGNTVAMEMEYFPESLIGSIKDAQLTSPAITDAFVDLGLDFRNITRALEDFPMEDYAILVAGMYRNRFSTYMKDSDGATGDIMRWTNSLVKVLGVRYPISYEVPLLLAFQVVSFLRLFLDQIFNATVVILVILGCILIYSLLLSDVEERNYDYGMLRALGMKKNTVIYIMVLQGLSYGVPGLGLGLLVSYIVSIPVLFMVSTFTKVPPVYELHPIAIAFGSCIGIAMPMVANILPIRRALGHTLRDSLDLYHQSSNEVKVTMIKLSKMGLSPTQIYVSLLLVVAGFTVFYMVPYSFQFGDFALFFTIMNAILLGMLVGLTLISQMLQPYLEKILLWLMIWGREKRLKPTVVKNMGSHRARNKKTALMFTVAVAFIIFAGTTFALQSNGIVKNLKLAFGADIVAQTSDVSAFDDEAEEERNRDSDISEFEGLPEEEMKRYLEKEMQRSDIVIDFTFVTPSLTTSKFIKKTRLSSLARTPRLNARYYGVQGNFLNVVYQEFFIASESEGGVDYDTIGFPPQEDLIKSLYTNPSRSSTTYSVPPVVTTGYIDDIVAYNEAAKTRDWAYLTQSDAIISEATRNRAALDTDTPISMEVQRADARVNSDGETGRDGRAIYLGNVRGMISKCPGFFFSSRQLFAWNSPVLTTVESWDDMYIYGRWGTNSTEAPDTLRDKERLFVRLKDGASLEERERVINGIRATMDQQSSSVWDTETALESTRLGAQMMNFFFIIVAVIAMSLCFFLLVLTVQANMRDNAWEFGVLRSLGVSSFMMVRIYIYEGLALIMASLILGTVTGILIAITLTLQFNMFLEFPFEFIFPWEIFLVVVVLALSFAVVGATVPVITKARKPIANILKKLD